MATNIDNVKLKKCNVTQTNTKYKCKRINVNGVKVWGAVPDYLFNNGSFDEDFPLTFDSNAAVEDGVIGITASVSLKNDTATVTNTSYSSYIDLSGADKITITGYTQIRGYYRHNVTATISLEDGNGNSVTVGTATQEMSVQSGSSSITQTSDFEMSITDFGNVNMENVRIRIYISYYASIPWENYYNSGGTIYIENIACE